MATKLEERPIKLAWPIVAGDDESLTIVVTGLNVTARTYTCHVRRHPTDATPVATAACSSVLVGADTEITVSFTNAQTRTLGDAGIVFVYDIQESAGGVISTLIGGPMTVRQDVTR